MNGHTIDPTVDVMGRPKFNDFVPVPDAPQLDEPTNRLFYIAGGPSADIVATLDPSGVYTSLSSMIRVCFEAPRLILQPLDYDPTWSTLMPRFVKNADLAGDKEMIWMWLTGIEWVESCRALASLGKARRRPGNTV